MTLKKVAEIVAEKTGLEEKFITLDSGFKEDLKIDSLDIFEIIMEIEDEYSLEIPTEDLENMKKVADLVNYIDRRLG